MGVTLSFQGKEQAEKLSFLSNAQVRLIEQSVDADFSKVSLENSNVLLRSENLDALKAILRLNYQFNIIYIDPPYNSGSSLSYFDSLQSDSWLEMMYPRLLLAKQVLRDDGIMFVSIDDRECSNLVVLMREIFGTENHISTIKWRKKRKPSFLNKHISSVIEYVIVFAKNKNNLLKLVGKKSIEKSRPVLNASNSPVNRILKEGMLTKCKDGIYKKGKYLNRTLSLELLNDAIISNGKLCNNVNVIGQFRVSQDFIDRSVYITKKFGLRRHVSEEEQVFCHATDDATVDYETNESGEKQLKKVFSGLKIFDFPKPLGLIKNLIQMYQTNTSEKISCLDFFAGSATLAQAVYELNVYLKHQKYSFCCVQKEEKINKKLPLSEIKTIADIAENRIRIVEDMYNIFPRCKIFISKSQKHE